jgi:CRISPR-associated protein Csh1
MLRTLLEIGEWQSKGKGEWDRFLEYPKIIHEDKKGNRITNYVLPILFDLDEMEVVIDRKELREYRESDVVELKAIKVQGGNNKAFYVTVPSDKVIQLFKSFFGKEEDKSPEIELLEAIRKVDNSLLTDKLQSLLQDIFSLRAKVLEKFQYQKNNNEIEIDKKAIENILEIQGKENLSMIYVKVKSKKHGLFEPIDFANIEEYNKFLRKKFNIDNSEKKNTSSINKCKVCYASGELFEDVKELNLAERYSINKMFVTETKNYAVLFSDNNYFQNYQVSDLNQEKLDFASKYLLNNLKVKIANIDHVIIPQFRKPFNIDIELALSNIKQKSDLLFSFDVLENFSENIEDEVNNTFWLNFIAFESDGNFFKTTELIKDVSKFHFQKVIKAFFKVHWDFKEAKFVDWNYIMTDYGKAGRFFNFNSVYTLIPLRKDKEKKNKALALFKSILENRTVNRKILFDYFAELILCYYYERHNSYTNVSKSSKDYFGISVKKSVFKYLAFIQVLKKLNLIDMEEVTTPKQEETLNQYDKSIQDFFSKMQLNQQQQAMFFLGRMLNAVEYMQVQKKIKKTVINLVNFNGLDKDDIERLRNDLINKARQHSQMGKVIFTNGKFGELFDYNGWQMQANEALFFLLTGYSFGINIKEAVEREKVELEEDIN